MINNPVHETARVWTRGNHTARAIQTSCAKLARLLGIVGMVLVAAGMLLLAQSALAGGFTFSRGFNEPGNILIADQFNNRIIEVSIFTRQIVWQYPGPNTNVADQLTGPNSAELLENGHILIADQGNNRAIEVSRAHVILRTFSAGNTANIVAFASRLAD